MIKTIALLILLASSSTLFAESKHFTETVDSMIQQLSVQKSEQPASERDSLDDLSAEILLGEERIRGNGLSQMSNKKRGLIRITVPDHATIADEQSTQQEYVYLPMQQTQPHINLKVEFDLNSYSIRAGSFKLLQKLGKALSSHTLQEKRFFINGHTDSDGREDYNLKLSLNRALSVRKYLQAHFKIPVAHLKVMGYGEGMPLKPNTSINNKQLNRRVEVVVR